MRERIKRIMKEEGLQASSFADKIQVSHGAITHILNGRNNPSKETIDKILKTFPYISDSWFLRGEGEMYNHERIVRRPTLSSAPVQQDLFPGKNTVESSGKLREHEYSQKNEVNKAENKTNPTVIQEIKIPTIPAKKIDKIMIFFNDKTFMTFIPEE